MNRLAGAPIAMHEKGQLTDASVLEEIMHKPGITIAEIAQNLEWTNGKVDGSINRLAAEGKVSIKHLLKRGMLVKAVYPAQADKKPAEQIEIPCDMMKCDLFKEKAYVYALSRSTIGIAHQQIEEWDTRTFSREIVLVRKNAENLVLELPKRVADFYQLENSEISLSTVGNLIFITVESILPVERSIKNSEESKYALISR